MTAASNKTVKGDFDNARFDYFGQVYRFFREDEDFWLEQEDSAGQPQRVRISYTFGHFPLQQYLVGFDDGRYQVLNVAWDSRTREEGGQRWFHLFPDKPLLIDSPLHWQGPFQRWNSRCAHCHSTGLEKSYDQKRSRYDSRWAEINVACEACHGPGSAHLAWAKENQENTNKDTPHFALTRWLKSETQWQRTARINTAARQGESNPQQLEACAGCHSRRELMAETGTSGTRFEDHHQLRLLEEPLYYPDGQIRDEVFVYGSFLQSKMHQRGVVCSDCHQPHSLKLKAEGNALCTRCHSGSEFDQSQHHQHSEGSTGAQCVNCHMPATTYMQIDPRRDHSLRIPRPDLSEKLGTPNACNQCHKDRSVAWAKHALDQWLKQSGKSLPRHFGETLHALRSGEAQARQQLQALLTEPLPPLVRATALLELPRYPDRASLHLLQQEAEQSDPLLRRAALQALRSFPVNKRSASALKALHDPVRAVRLAALQLLLEIPLERLPANSRERVAEVEAEYREVLRLNADSPEGQLRLGSYYSARQQYTQAEQHLRRALEFNPQLVPALFNLAELLRRLGRDSEAAALLEQALFLAPEDASLHYAQGLLQVRQKKYKQATKSLAQAYMLEPANLQYGYVFAVSLEASGDIPAAVLQLEQLLQRFPNEPRLLQALIGYHQRLGQLEQAHDYLQRLKKLGERGSP